MINDRHAQLLERRGIDVEIADQLGIESSDKLGSDTIAIPYLVGGEVVNWKYRTLGRAKRFSQQEGGKQVLWNFDVVTDPTLQRVPLIICEGELDALSAIQAGFIRTVSVPNGAPQKSIPEGQDERKYSYILEYLPLLKGVDEIVLATDGDDQGVNLMNDLALRLGRTRCKFLRYPKGCKDLNDALRDFGIRGVVATLGKAEWIRIGGVYRMSELPPYVEPKAFDTGFPGLEPHFKVRPGDMTIVTGVPSAGKSTFIDNILCYLAKEQGWQIGLLAAEQRPQTDLRRFLRTWFHRKMVIYQSEAERARADEWIEAHFNFILPVEDEAMNFEWVLERMSAAVIQKNVNVIAIDPWNEIIHERPEFITETDYIGYALMRIRKFAEKHQVHVFVLAHPTKMQRTRDGGFPTPTLYDISGSAHWSNKAVVGIVIFKNEDNHTVVRVTKVRYQDVIGTPGDVVLGYDKSTAHYFTVVGDVQNMRQTH